MAQRYHREFQLRQATACLNAGGVLAYPTEAIWGLGCNPFDQDATLRLLEIKQRPVDKGLILVASSIDQLGSLLLPLTDAQRSRVGASWPGPTTWLIPDTNNIVPWWIKGAHTAVAVRVSAHSQVSALCRYFGGPIVSTSANRAGQPPAKTALAVQRQMGGQVDKIFNGRLGGSTSPSTIIDVVTGQVMR